MRKATWNKIIHMAYSYSSYFDPDFTSSTSSTGATMYEDWNSIMEDPLKPFFNRAFGAEYPPGSSFKMCTLISAMEHRNRKANNSHRKNDRKDRNYEKNQENFNNLEKNGGKKPHKPQPQKVEEEIKSIKVPDHLTLRELAERMKLNPSVLIKKLFMKGVMMTLNSDIDYEKAEEIALEFDILCKYKERFFQS